MEDTLTLSGDSMLVRVWDVSKGISKPVHVEDLPHMTKPTQDDTEPQHITAISWEVRYARLPPFLTYVLEKYTAQLLGHSFD